MNCEVCLEDLGNWEGNFCLVNLCDQCVMDLVGIGSAGNEKKIISFDCLSQSIPPDSFSNNIRNQSIEISTQELERYYFGFNLDDKFKLLDILN